MIDGVLLIINCCFLYIIFTFRLFDFNFINYLNKFYNDYIHSQNNMELGVIIKDKDIIDNYNNFIQKVKE